MPINLSDNQFIEYDAFYMNRLFLPDFKNNPFVVCHSLSVPAYLLHLIIHVFHFIHEHVEMSIYIFNTLSNFFALLDYYLLSIIIF